MLVHPVALDEMPGARVHRTFRMYRIWTRAVKGGWILESRNPPTQKVTIGVILRNISFSLGSSWRRNLELMHMYKS